MSSKQICREAFNNWFFSSLKFIEYPTKIILADWIFYVNLLDVQTGGLEVDGEQWEDIRKLSSRAPPRRGRGDLIK